MILTYTIGDLFTNAGIQMSGSYQLFSIILLMMVVVYLAFVRAPGFLILTNVLLLTGAMFGWGSFTQLILGIGGVVVGTMIALSIWRIYLKGDIP